MGMGQGWGGLEAISRLFECSTVVHCIVLHCVMQYGGCDVMCCAVSCGA